MNHFNTRKSKKRKGAAAVEFALVAPVFLIFLFGTMELGRLALARNVVANASREAARLAIIQGATDQEVIAAAKSFSEAGSIDGVNVEVTETSTTKSVRVSIGFRDVSWLPNAWFLKEGQTLSSITTMRKENIEITSVPTGT